ncbi:hypothetical protein MNBD_DELTA02-402 [hydrothermal vent metagenome]|uniref:Uncharacterized protein n=1 Tax=hydrothermal vent metagenome TaxID=652676 RepID=A0A3B0VMC0_9ZZZZ
MTVVKRIARNVVFMTVAQVSGYGLGFFYIIYTARYLGAEGFGILSFALAFTAIFGVLTDIGLQPLTVREVARDKTLAPKYLANLTSIKFILSAITFALIAVVINIMDYPAKTVEIVYIVALSVLVNSFITMIYSIFQAHERMEFQSIGQVISSAVMLIGAVLAIKAGLDITVFATLYLIASLFALIYSLLILGTRFKEVCLGWCRRKIFELDVSFWKATLKEALPFGLGLFFMMIFYWVDSVMLSQMKGNAVVGWYNAAYRMVLVLLFIPQTLINALYPVMSTFKGEDAASLRNSHEKSLKYLSILALPIAVGTTLLAPRFILLIFGPEYENSVLPLQILVWSAVFIYMSITYGNLFNCLNKQGLVTIITGTCVLANVIFNLLLIPRYSLVGASIATVLTELTSLCLCIALSMRSGYASSGKKLSNILIKTIISSTVMGLFILISGSLHLALIIPAAAVIYFISVYVTGAVDRDDIVLFQSVLSRK